MAELSEITTYVCFDADDDMDYYRALMMWKKNQKIDFNFENAHEINNIRDGSSEDTIKRKLRERMKHTDLLIVLIGENTKNLYKYVRWEIELALEKNFPIIGVNLNKKITFDHELCPAILRDEMAIHVSFRAKILKYAMKNWPERHFILQREHSKDEDYKKYGQYRESVYKELGLLDNEDD
jgi:hypothetical protein